MEINPIKEQRKIAKKYIIGYFSYNEELISSLKSKLFGSDINLEFVNLSEVDNDFRSLYTTVVDEIITTEITDEFKSFVESAPDTKFFICVDDLADKVQLNSMHNVSYEVQTKENMPNHIQNRANLILNIKRLQAKDKEKSLKFIMQLVSILENKDPFTKDHSARVEKYAIAIAEAYLPEKYDEVYGHLKSQNPDQYEARKHEYIINQLNTIMLAAWAHDIGKNGISNGLLNKKTVLNQDEFDMMKMHADFGAEMIRKLLGDEDLAEAIENHHERIDGTGYHSRDSFSDAAKLIAIADSFDAMTTARPYTTKLDDLDIKRKIYSIQDAINELQVSSHLHYDADKNAMVQQLDTKMTDIFVRLLKRDLELIQDGKQSEVTVLDAGLDENGYIKAGFWDDKTQEYTKDMSVGEEYPRFYT